MNKEIQLLWVDLTLTKPSQDTAEAFTEFFAVKELYGQKFTETNCKATQPDAIIFDYDFPDRGSLNILLQTKRQFTSIPIIMVTEQHSEELALWALHARVWEYLIKPISTDQLHGLKNELLKLENLRHIGETKRFLFEREPHAPHEARVSPADSSKDIIQRATNYISAHINEKITEPQLANLCDMSPYRFSRLFKQNCSCTFQEYLVQQRIKEAVRLLANPSTPVSDIAFAVGFNDASYFTRAFKRYIGVSPSDFRTQPNDCEQRINHLFLLTDVYKTS